MNNAAIAAHLADLAAARAADTSIPARARAIRAGHYTAAAVAAQAAGVELASLDAAGVRAALGCGAKIAAAVVSVVAAERAARDQAVAGIVAHVEAGTVPAGEVADVAATLADYLAVDGVRLPAATVARVKAAIAALQPPAPACGCQLKASGHGRSKACSTDGRRYAVRWYEPTTDTYETYAACWACARHTVRLARAVEYYPRCSEIPTTRAPRRTVPAGRQYGHLVAMTGGQR